MKAEAKELEQAMNDQAHYWCSDGGYPNEFKVVGEHLVGATIDHAGRPVLYTKTLDEALKLFREAKSSTLICTKSLSLFEAMSEVGLGT